MSSRQLDLWKLKQKKKKQQTVDGSSGSVSQEWFMPEKVSGFYGLLFEFANKRFVVHELVMLVEDVDFYFEEVPLTPPKDEVDCVADDAIKIPKDKLGDMLAQVMKDNGIRREDIRRVKDGDETRFGYVTCDTETGVEEIVLFKK
ncbi:unnamed protein product [Microthlaspi erraticum]|uniref:Uncharacterized protein n=1 Tax=Microthlaspi erraticum TaxID=1685480 RepID=A0A6D2IWJ9_9BRAS|nr:unnamed protein product [Microthlaspi erraticum]